MDQRQRRGSRDGRRTDRAPKLLVRTSRALKSVTLWGLKLGLLSSGTACLVFRIAWYLRRGSLGPSPRIKGHLPEGTDPRSVAAEERLAAAYRRLEQLNQRVIIRALVKLTVLFVFVAVQWANTGVSYLENMLFILFFLSALLGVITRSGLSPLVLGPWDEAAFFLMCGLSIRACVTLSGAAQ
jgi:hypothetical protein